MRVYLYLFVLYSARPAYEAFGRSVLPSGGQSQEWRPGTSWPRLDFFPLHRFYWVLFCPLSHNKEINPA